MTSSGKLTDQQLEAIRSHDKADDYSPVGPEKYNRAFRERELLLDHIEATSPRIITELDELRDLPSGSVVRDAAGDVAEKHPDGTWMPVGNAVSWVDETFKQPVAVLYVPEAGGRS